jgi:hypothetical protein
MLEAAACADQLLDEGDPVAAAPGTTSWMSGCGPKAPVEGERW